MLAGHLGMSGETLYRAMLSDEDGSPSVGSGRNMLGVRPAFDVKEPAGPHRGGMSVTVRNPEKMIAPVRPKAFGGLNGETVMYQLDEDELLAPGLALGPIDPRTLHAVVEAAESCSVADLQARLGRTRASWTTTPLPAAHAVRGPGS